MPSRRELVRIRTVQRFNYQLRHAHIIARKRKALGCASVRECPPTAYLGQSISNVGYLIHAGIKTLRGYLFHGQPAEARF